MFENGKIQRKFFFDIKTVFVQISEKAQILTKKIFLHKFNHITLHYNFLLFWSIFRVIHCKLIYLVKYDYHIKSEKSWEKFGFDDYYCFCQTGEKIWTNFFFLPKINDPHRSELCLSVVLWHFRGNYLSRKLRNILKVSFSQQVWKGANPEEKMDLK